MGFKIKQLGTPFQTFTANIGPVNLTAGVPVAEIYFGLYAQHVKTAALTLETFLGIISEVTVTRRGQTVISIENGLDLLALIKAPWFDHAPDYTTGGSSAHYYYCKGLTLPTNFPPGYSGEFQLTVENTDNASLGSEVLSTTEGQGEFGANYFPTSLLRLMGGHHWHIVKRLYTPAGTGWNNGFDIGTEGWLCGLLIWQTTEEERLVAKTANSLYEVELDIGGEEIIRADCLTQQGTQGRPGSQSSASVQTQENAFQSILDQYVFFDFRSQPWDCRGKTVVLKTNAGTADAIRAYPLFLVPWENK